MNENFDMSNSKKPITLKSKTAFPKFQSFPLLTPGPLLVHELPTHLGMLRRGNLAIDRTGRRI